MPGKRLFHVKDCDRPMWVVAFDWKDAVEAWKLAIANENEMEAGDVEEPLGVNFICHNDELIVE